MIERNQISLIRSKIRITESTVIGRLRTRFNVSLCLHVLKDIVQVTKRLLEVGCGGWQTRHREHLVQWMEFRKWSVKQWLLADCCWCLKCNSTTVICRASNRRKRLRYWGLTLSETKLNFTPTIYHLSYWSGWYVNTSLFVFHVSIHRI